MLPHKVNPEKALSERYILRNLKVSSMDIVGDPRSTRGRPNYLFGPTPVVPPVAMGLGRDVIAKFSGC